MLAPRLGLVGVGAAEGSTATSLVRHWSRSGSDRLARGLACGRSRRGAVWRASVASAPRPLDLDTFARFFHCSPCNQSMSVPSARATARRAASSAAWGSRSVRTCARTPCARPEELHGKSDPTGVSRSVGGVLLWALGGAGALCWRWCPYARHGWPRRSRRLHARDGRLRSEHSGAVSSQVNRAGHAGCRSHCFRLRLG